MSTNNKVGRFLRGSSLAWGVMTFLAIGIALYAVSPYLTFNPARSRIPLNVTVPLHFLVLTIHAAAGGFALLIGPFQFLPRFRQRFPEAHRLFGRIYIICILISSIMAAYSALVSVDGFVAQTGFILLAVSWFYSIVQAYLSIRSGQVQLHRIWMVRNYALTTAAITLRLWVGGGAIYLALTHQMPTKLTFTPLYSTAAWISWIVPLVFAEWFINQRLLHSRVVVKREKDAVQEMSSTRQ